MNKSKVDYHKKFFKSNCINIKNTSKKNPFIAYNSKTLKVPRALSLNSDNNITNPHVIVNIFYDYRASVDETSKLNLKPWHNHFSEHLKSQCSNKVFIQSKDNIKYPTSTGSS